MKTFVSILIIVFVAVSSAFPDRGSRIINGRDARPGEAPYMIQVTLRDRNGIIRPFQHCGGALVNANWFLSAAHCFQLSPQSRFTYVIFAGQHNTRVNSGNEQERSVARIINHPRYDNDAELFSGFDISAVNVNQPFTLNQWVQPIILPPRNYRHKGNIQVFGWGATQPNGGGIPDILQTTTLIVVDQDLCVDILTTLNNGRNPVNQYDMCAGPLDGKQRSRLYTARFLNEIYT